jgi:hypothetical protein
LGGWLETPASGGASGVYSPCMLKLATRRRVRTGLIGGYGTVAYLAARIALPHAGSLLQIGYAACSRAAYAAMAPLERSDAEEMRVPPHRVRPAARPWRGLGPPVQPARGGSTQSRSLGILPGTPLPSWGRCDIPGQYRCRWDDEGGESPPPRNPGLLIFHRPGLTGGPTAADRGEGSRRCSQAPPGQATTHLASPEPAPCCRRRPRRIPGSVPFGGDSVRSKPTSITSRIARRHVRPHPRSHSMSRKPSRSATARPSGRRSPPLTTALGAAIHAPRTAY